LSKQNGHRPKPGVTPRDLPPAQGMDSKVAARLTRSDFRKEETHYPSRLPPPCAHPKWFRLGQMRAHSAGGSDLAGRGDPGRARRCRGSWRGG
jgi:hypothetical protein